MSNKNKKRLKKGEGLELLTGAIRSGEDTNKKIKTFLNWDRRTFWYYKDKAIKEGMIKVEEGKFILVLADIKFADKKTVSFILNNLKDDSQAVRIEAGKDLERLSMYHVIKELDFYSVLIDEISKVRTGELNDLLTRSLTYLIINTAGSDLGGEILKKVSKQPELLRDVLLDKTSQSNTRKLLIKILSEVDKDFFKEALFEMILDSTYVDLVSYHEGSGHVIHSYLAGEVTDVLRKFPEEDLKDINKRAYRFLKEYEGNKEIVERIKFLTGVLREKLI